MTCNICSMYLFTINWHWTNPPNPPAVWTREAQCSDFSLLPHSFHNTHSQWEPGQEQTSHPGGLELQTQPAEQAGEEGQQRPRWRCAHWGSQTRCAISWVAPLLLSLFTGSSIKQWINKTITERIKVLLHGNRFWSTSLFAFQVKQHF